MKDLIRISFEVPVEDHTFLKMECAKSRITMKDFLHELFIAEIKELKEKHLLGRLMSSIQQAKEGKVTTMSLSELEKFAEDDK